jgi:23S rRNA (guanine745-N1)-methyltransferase
VTEPELAVFACPHCGLPLVDTAIGATCPSGHTFDRAREGYLNLLVGGRIASQSIPGDTPDSLTARRRFLHAGHYAPIAATLATMVGQPDGAVLDAGCGEGYYLSCLVAPHLFGLDVSKRAVQMASRLLPGARFVVASSYRLPVLDHCLDVIISVFAPRPFDEFRRALAPVGRWVTVTPGGSHLQEMRPARDDEPGSKSLARRSDRDQAPTGATQVERVHFTLDLTPESAIDLFSMTPMRWQAGADTDHIASLRQVTVDAWVASGTS